MSGWIQSLGHWNNNLLKSGFFLVVLKSRLGFGGGNFEQECGTLSKYNRVFAKSRVWEYEERRKADDQWLLPLVQETNKGG
jgi:hypothetical protein